MNDPNKWAGSKYTIGTIIVLTLIGFVNPFLSDSVFKEYLSNLAISSIEYGIILLLIGVLTIFVKPARSIAQGILISSLIQLLLSFSLCTLI